MKNLLHVLVGVFILLTQHTALAQTLHNGKNVDRTAMSYYDGLQTFRALEYTVSADPQSTKIYRLETMPENGFPAVVLRGLSQGSIHTFEDKSPYSNVFTDNATPYSSEEAVQAMSGFQRVMLAYSQRFGWKGIDGVGLAPINVKLENSDETAPNVPIYTAYLKGKDFEVFNFGRSISNSAPFMNVIEAIAHEYAHAVLRYRTGIGANTPETCSEFRAVNEGIADVFGIYIKNQIKKNSPQNFDWIFADQNPSQTRDVSNPKSYGSPDTYNGEHYINICTTDYDPHPGAGILQRWFYLLVAGFPGPALNDLNYSYNGIAAIGPEKAIQILWEAIPHVKLIV